MIAWANFTPIPAFVGGLLIGVAAAMLILLNGRIAGVSGILGRLLQSWGKESAWSVLFILGLVLAPWFYSLAAPLPEAQIEAGHARLIIAGLLVGIGTRLASGCTSGHGVCGLSRLSLRSLAATITFMLAGIVTVPVVRHLLA
ncbi:YeeE/YedE family protein [Methylovorus menthalis]|uniref:YeeE/YedE family protein n=1 Tax=Methylovorus menthalis TaxID=1002227 RepID=UPI001E344CE4|nr:YeeE/YedE family protein [Methylovorus menthalis]MCB4811096.1 YeeE/YedE family protein [Methylovorus menthalis]